MPRKTIFLSKKKCRICKKSFQPKAVTSVLCSDICRFINHRESVSERMRKMRDKKRATVIEIKCKNCKKSFLPIPSNRVFCTKECSQKYRPPRKRISSAKYERHHFKNFTLKKEKSSQDILRDEIDEAVKLYLAEGGVIEKLKSPPLPKIPTVGSRDWDWETTVGLGYAGLEDLAEPEYNISNVIKT